MTLFQAFIDESVGVAPDGDFVLGGHIAPAWTWSAFAKAWQKKLPLGVEAKDGNYRFKMSEMALSPERMARVEVFSEVVDEHIDLSISCRLNLGEFENAKKRAHAFFSRMNWTVDIGKWNNPYYVCFRHLLATFHANKDQISDQIPTSETVDFIFDERTEKRYILAAWDEVLDRLDESERKKYGSHPRFEDDNKCVPLQAADFWSWWVREWFEEDASEIPDKMRAFDFGLWKGKERKFISMSMDENTIYEHFKETLAQSFAEGNLDPLSAAIVRGEM